MERENAKTSSWRKRTKVREADFEENYELFFSFREISLFLPKKTMDSQQDTHTRMSKRRRSGLKDEESKKSKRRERATVSQEEQEERN